MNEDLPQEKILSPAFLKKSLYPLRSVVLFIAVVAGAWAVLYTLSVYAPRVRVPTDLVSTGSGTPEVATASSGTKPIPTQPIQPQPIPDQILVGAGDIASCASTGDEATAALLDNISGTVFTLGDNVYDSGTAAEFTNCYQPSWGRHKARTRPSAGNHDYNTPSASGYFGYFGTSAGAAGSGYYSYDLGAWHIVVLNSNCSAIGGCGAGSSEELWLRNDLALSSKVCTLAYWHHPRFSSGSVHGNDISMQAFWQALYDYKADLVLGGHEHNYERFARQDPTGAASAQGIREFVVGTGGRSHYEFGAIQANSEVRNSDTYGVLKLTLKDGSYSWDFIPEAGKSFTDSGSSTCVN